MQKGEQQCDASTCCGWETRSKSTKLASLSNNNVEEDGEEEFDWNPNANMENIAEKRII